MILVFSTGVFAFADRAGYTIDNFDVQIDINEDGSAQIEENISVDFVEPRHGIYRDIPLMYQSSYITIDNIASNRNIHNIIRENDILRIQLGDSSKELLGNHLYTITYTVANVIKTFS